MLVQLLMVIPVFPFYAGVVKITAKMAAGEEKVPVFRTLFRRGKREFSAVFGSRRCLYVAVVFSYVSFRCISACFSQSTLFFGPLIISVIVILLFHLHVLLYSVHDGDL